jgi:hypothetical protein
MMFWTFTVVALIAIAYGLALMFNLAGLAYDALESHGSVPWTRWWRMPTATPRVLGAISAGFGTALLAVAIARFR